MILVVRSAIRGATWRPFLLLFAAGTMASCASSSQEFAVEGEAQGSTFVVRAYGDSLRVSEEDVARWLQEYNSAVSVWDPSSELSRLNRGEAVSPSAILADLLLITGVLREATDSIVEPSLEPILKAWGFTAGGSPLLPSGEGPARDSVLVDSLMLRVRWTPIAGVKGPMTLTRPINVNAFAQGHSVDLLLDSLRARGATAAFVEIGGEVRAFGQKSEDKSFTVGIEKPLTSGDRSLQLTVKLDDRALATSGNYRKFQVDSATGLKYGHSIDPRTGWPAPTDILSATLIGPTCAEADAYATMAMVIGMQSTKQWLAGHPEWDAILIYSDPKGGVKIYNSLK
jgi:FAD:protein FMN transferase